MFASLHFLRIVLNNMLVCPLSARNMSFTFCISLYLTPLFVADFLSLSLPIVCFRSFKKPFLHVT